MAATPQAPSAAPVVIVHQRVALPSAGGPPQRASATQRAQDADDCLSVAGVAPETIRLWVPPAWVPVDFPLDRPQAAIDFVTAAFEHMGWRLLDRFSTDIDAAYRGLPGTLRNSLASADQFRRASSQLRAAKNVLRPRVAAALDRVEVQAFAILNTRLNTVIAQAPALARDLLVLPDFDGRTADPESLLSVRWTRSNKRLASKPVPLDISRPAGRQLRSLISSLVPAATELGNAKDSKEIADIVHAIEKVIRAGAWVSPMARTAAEVIDDATAAITAAHAAGAVSEKVQAILTGHASLIETWRERQARFVVARQAAAAVCPVLHRFGYADFIAADSENDVQLGARVAGVLGAVFSGAFGVREHYIEPKPGKQSRVKRPAKELLRALTRANPPGDPVRFVMERAEGSVWAHDALIQSALEAMARGSTPFGPFDPLDGFDATVSSQALAEGATLKAESVGTEAAIGLGISAGLIALHFLAPPVALIADAGFAAYDLSTSIRTFAAESVEFRCSFDPALSLGEEPSLAWFVASQAFNLLTVG